MKRDVILGMVLLFAGLATEAHSFYYRVWPKDAASPAYYIDGYPDRPVTKEWVVIFTADCLYRLSLCFVAGACARRPSTKLAFVFWLHFAYNLIDYSLLLINNKKGYLHYWILVFVLSFSVVAIISSFGTKQKSKIVQL